MWGILNWLKNYTIVWFVLVWLQFVLQFDEEVIAWTCNGLQKNCQIVSDTAKKNSKIQILKLLKDRKILKNKIIHCLEIIKIKQNTYD